MQYRNITISVTNVLRNRRPGGAVDRPDFENLGRGLQYVSGYGSGSD